MSAILEALRDSRLNIRAVSLITDGLKKEDHLLAAVVSSLNEFGLKDWSKKSEDEIDLYPFPGGSPVRTEAYTGFTDKDYEQLDIPSSEEDASKILAKNLEDVDMIISYNRSFWNQFAPPALQSIPMLVVGSLFGDTEGKICKHLQNDDELIETKTLSDKAEEAEKFSKYMEMQGWSVPFIRLLNVLSLSFAEDTPQWLKTHHALRFCIGTL